MPAKLGTSTQCRQAVHTLAHTPAGHQEAFLRSMSIAASAGRLTGPGLLSLPPDVLVDLTYRLDERDPCSLELVSKRMPNVLLAFNRGPGERWLDLTYGGDRLLSPEGLRSFT